MSEVGERLNLWKLADTRIMPESFEYVKNGGRKYLFRNLGGGRFRDVTREAGVESSRWTLAAVAADLRGTGFPDLFIANDYGVSEYFANEGGHFREVGRGAQSFVTFLVAAVEAIFRLLQFVHAPYYALFVVGPAAMLVQIALDRRRAALTVTPATGSAPAHAARRGA